MADLTPEEASKWFGGRTPTQEEIDAEVRRAQSDPIGFWWDTMMGNRGTAAGRTVSASGGGVDPMRSSTEAAALADALGVPGSVRGSTELDARFRAGAGASGRVNPYSTIVANQSRPAQEALYAQMLARQAGPSLAAMQGGRAQGQNLQAALTAGGGRPVMNRAAAVGGGLAGDVGMGRLAEQLRGSQGIGSLATGVRAADLGVAGAQSQSGLQQRTLDDAMRQFYAAQGARLFDANAGLQAEREKLIKLGKMKREAQNMQTVKDQAGAMATVASLGMGG